LASTALVGVPTHPHPGVLSTHAVGLVLVVRISGPVHAVPVHKVVHGSDMVVNMAFKDVQRLELVPVHVGLVHVNAMMMDVAVEKDE
jgi:hypothetical protein